MSDETSVPPFETQSPPSTDIPALLSGIIKDFQSLIKQQFQLARQEITANLKLRGKVTAMFAAAVALALGLGAAWYVVVQIFQFVWLPDYVAVFITREMTGDSWKHIGTLLGDRDHTSMMHGYHKINELVRNDRGLRSEVRQIMRGLQPN